MTVESINSRLQISCHIQQGAIQQASLHHAETLNEAQELVLQGCTFNARNNKGKTPLDVQIHRFSKEPENQNIKEIIKFLIINDPAKGNALSRELFKEFLFDLSEYISSTSFPYASSNEKRMHKLQGVKNYLDVLCLFMENGVDPNKAVSAFTQSFMLPWVVDEARVNCMLDDESFALLERLLKQSIKLEMIDRPQTSFFHRILEDMITRVGYYDSYRKLADLLVAKGSKLEGSSAIFNNRLFHRAISNCELTGFFKGKVLHLDHVHYSKVLNYLIDLGGGVVNDCPMHVRMGTKMICEIRGDKKNIERVKNGDYIVLLSEKGSVNFFTEKGIYTEIFERDIIPSIKALEKVYLNDLKNRELGIYSSSKKMMKAYYRMKREMKYFQRERTIELYLLLNKRDPHFRKTANWKTSYQRLILSKE